LTQLYGPAVRCKPNVKKWRGLVLRICIRPLHGAFVLLAIVDIRAHPISFSGMRANLESCHDLVDRADHCISFHLPGHSARAA
jgi:hypothetical protein